MATTTKTLTPTNQTITLPDMTERPDASVLVDGIGKDADAINALSDQIAKFDGSTTPYAGGQNPNNYTAPGVFHIGISADYSPTGSAIYGVLFVNRGTSGLIVQEFRSTNAKYYKRIKINSSTNWYGWQEMALSDQFASFLHVEELTYDSSNGYFPVTGIPRNGMQICVSARNISTGAIYILWYSHTQRAFRVGATISGNPPANGENVAVQFIQ